jgi:hypothetical protein
MTVRDAAPPAALSAPAAGGFASTIARAGLGTVEDDGGTSTITFPSPSGVPEYIPFSTAPVTVSRSLWDDAAGAASSYASNAVSQARSTASGYADQARESATGAIDQATAAAGGYADEARDYATGALDDAQAAATGYADQAQSAVTGALGQAQAAATGALQQARGALPPALANPGAAEKQFEELYDRLKRELMIEQEQLGQLFHEP